MTGAALTLALAATVLGAGTASAASPDATLAVAGASSTAQASGTGTTVAAGTKLTITGTSYGADEPVSFWINVPDGTTIPASSLGQDNSYVDGTVIPLNAMGSTDDSGAFSYTFDTTGMPAGDYSIVAHGLNTGIEQVLSFSVTAPTANPVDLSIQGDSAVSAGTILTINGISYGADEPVGLWINVPAGATVPAYSLGQDNTYIDGSVIPLNAMASTDDSGAFTYTLDTSGLPSGTYSLVAHGLNTGTENVVSFTIK